MALMDDKNFLLSHVRNSFITGDDTSMCELVLEDDVLITNEKHGRMSTASDIRLSNPWHISRNDGISDTDSLCDVDMELPNSYDIVPDMDFASHRRRCNTAQRLENLQKEKMKQSKIKHVVWKDAITPPDSDLFITKEVKVNNNVIRKSALSYLLEKTVLETTNYFLDYSKYNGKMAPIGVGVKNLEIILTMTTDKIKVMNVSIISTASVQNLIGLICYLYSHENKKPILKDKIDFYSLNIVDDDGEVETDFPALENKEPIIKFGFNKLALVENVNTVLEKECVFLTIHMPGRGATRISVSPKDTLRTVLEIVIEKRHLKTVKGLEYRIEKHDEPDISLNLDSLVCNMDTNEFCVIRDNSVRGDVKLERDVSQVLLNPDAYKSYQVLMVQKLGRKIPMQIGITGQRIEIDPVSNSGRNLFRLNNKAASYEIENVISCYLIEAKSSKTLIRLECRTNNDKQQDYTFESDAETAGVIIDQVSHILEIRGNFKPGSNWDISKIGKRGKKFKNIEKRNTLPAIFTTF